MTELRALFFEQGGEFISGDDIALDDGGCHQRVEEKLAQIAFEGAQAIEEVACDEAFKSD